MKFGQSLRHRFEEVLLVTLILLQIIDFLEILPGDLDFLKKIHSWVVLGYLFVKVSLSTIFFGVRMLWFDLSIIFTYFLFFAKDITAIAFIGLEEAHWLRPVLESITKNAVIIEKYAFIAAALALHPIVYYCIKKVKIKKDSFMGILGQHQQKNGIVRFGAVFFALLGFFVFIFNLAMEWLAIAIDAPMTILAILVYLFVIIRYHKHFSQDSLLHKIGDVGERFYENFLGLLKVKEKVSLAVIGILALHTLTDVGNFIIPYLVSLKDSLYFGQLGGAHIPLPQLLIQDLGKVDFPVSAALIGAYLANIIAMLFFLFLPALIFFQMIKHKKIKGTKVIHSLILGSLLVVAVFPVFSIERIGRKEIVGVDISTQSIWETPSWIQDLIPDKAQALQSIMLIALWAGAIIFFLEHWQWLKKDFFVFTVLIGLLFFGYYIFYFSVDILSYFWGQIPLLFQSGEFLIGSYFLMFLVLNVLLYAGGYIAFWYEIVSRHFFSE
ncbi:hypothetical protein HYU13_04885 [Candidatus Woesearchaeota archaeon]|nr:hypothetical protein [Candidatus Woesearchaeota archaeon]